MTTNNRLLLSLMLAVWITDRSIAAPTEPTAKKHEPVPPVLAGAISHQVEEEEGALAENFVGVLSCSDKYFNTLIDKVKTLTNEKTPEKLYNISCQKLDEYVEEINEVAKQIPSSPTLNKAQQTEVYETYNRLVAIGLPLGKSFLDQKINNKQGWEELLTVAKHSIESFNGTASDLIAIIKEKLAEHKDIPSMDKFLDESLASYRLIYREIKKVESFITVAKSTMSC